MADEVATTNEFGKATGQIAKITSTEVARSMVFKYAQQMLSKERAQEFFTQLGFLMRKSSKLAQCTPESFFVAAMQCVNLDLMPGTPEQYAAIIPYSNEAQFQLMYQGGKELAYRTGQIKTIKAELVFAEDEFDFDDAVGEIHHRKDLTIDRTVADKIKASYAVAKLTNGELQFVVMSPSEIKKIKGVVKAKKPGTPWAEWEEEMIKKTAIKRLLKDLPGSRTDNRFKYAVKWDSANEGGARLKVDMETGQIIEPDLEDSVKASPDKKQAIIEANAVTDGDDKVIIDPETDKRAREALAKEREVKKPKVNIKEEANRRWAKKPEKSTNEKQASLINDNEV